MKPVPSGKEVDGRVYEVGDKVVYPQHGAGTIVKKEQREEREYLTIQIAHKDMTVMIPTDFTTDVHALRGVVERIVQSSPLWDRRSWALQVVDATPDGMQLRCVVTARNASDLFDLRCDVREQVMAHLARTPNTLPTRRAHAEFAASNSG